MQSPTLKVSTSFPNPRTSKHLLPRKRTNVPENQWLEDVFSIEIVPFYVGSCFWSSIPKVYLKAENSSMASHPPIPPFPILGDHLLQWLLFGFNRMAASWKSKRKPWYWDVCLSTDFRICGKKKSNENSPQAFEHPEGFGFFVLFCLMCFHFEFNMVSHQKSHPMVPWRGPLPHVPSLPAPRSCPRRLQVSKVFCTQYRIIALTLIEMHLNHSKFPRNVPPFTKKTCKLTITITLSPAVGVLNIPPPPPTHAHLHRGGHSQLGHLLCCLGLTTKNTKFHMFSMINLGCKFWPSWNTLKISATFHVLETLYRYTSFLLLGWFHSMFFSYFRKVGVGGSLVAALFFNSPSDNAFTSKTSGKSKQ